MALSKITYTDKETLNPLPSIADKNKVTNNDMNEIKSVVNAAIDQVDANTIPQQTTAPADPEENDLWIDTDESGITNIDSVVSTSSTNPIENQAITNYVNTINGYSETETDTGSKWVNNKTIYKKVIHSTTSITLNSNTWATTGISITNIETIINCSFINTSNWTIMPMCAYYDTNYSSVQILNLRTVNFSTSDWYLTLEYTKSS